MEEAKKIVLLGDEKTGKTQMIEIGLMGKSDKELFPRTVGSHFYAKNFHVDGKELNFQIWDTSGDPRYRGLLPIYVKNAEIVLLVYDINNVETFNNINYFAQMVNENLADSTIFLVANSIQEGLPRKVSEREGRQKAKEIKATYAEINCRTRQGFAELFENVLGVYIPEREIPHQSSPITHQRGHDCILPDALENESDRERKPSDKKPERVEVCIIQ